MNAWVAARASRALSAAHQGDPKALDRLMWVALPFNRPGPSSRVTWNLVLVNLKCKVGDIAESRRAR